LHAAGIEKNIFEAHSTKGASTSKANKLGLSVEQIMKIANWKSATTFQNFYNKPVEGDSEFGNTVLSIYLKKTKKQTTNKQKQKTKKQTNKQKTTTKNPIIFLSKCL
jgi:hypothetical protein